MISFVRSKQYSLLATLHAALVLTLLHELLVAQAIPAVPVPVLVVHPVQCVPVPVPVSSIPVHTSSVPTLTRSPFSLTLMGLTSEFLVSVSCSQPGQYVTNWSLVFLILRRCRGRRVRGPCVPLCSHACQFVMAATCGSLDAAARAVHLASAPSSPSTWAPV